jgi:hypothetical protein
VPNEPCEVLGAWPPPSAGPVDDPPPSATQTPAGADLRPTPQVVLRWDGPVTPGRLVGRRLRLAYVMHGGLGGLSPAAALARWPDTPHLLAALARRGDLDVSGVWRVPLGHPGEAFTRDRVRYTFVPDGPRLARRLAATVAAADPDVVHVNGLVFPLPTLLLRARVGRRARIVVQHHGELPPARRRARERNAQRPPPSTPTCSRAGGRRRRSGTPLACCPAGGRSST